MTSLPSAGEDDKEAIETKISTLQYALDNDIPLSSGFLDDESGSGDILSGFLGLSGWRRHGIRVRLRFLHYLHLVDLHSRSLGFPNALRICQS